MKARDFDPKRALVLTFGAASSILLLAWTARFVLDEHTLYFWDSLNYWTRSATLIDVARHNFVNSFLLFGLSLHEDYNDVGSLPAACVMALTGTGRVWFILSNAVFWVLPGLACVLIFVLRASTATWASTLWTLMTFLTLLLVPLPWLVTVRGYVDAGGLIFASIVTGLFIRTDPRSGSVRDRVMIGVGLAVLALFRRWYLYLVVGLVVVALTEAVFILVAGWKRKGGLDRPTVEGLVLGPVIILSTLALVYGVLSFPLLLQLIQDDYSYRYAAFQRSDTWLGAFSGNLSAITSFYGWGFVTLALACSLVGLWGPATRRGVIYLFVPALIGIAFFSRVQAVFDHHALLGYLALVGTPLFVSRDWFESHRLAARRLGWGVVLLALFLAGAGFQRLLVSAPEFPSNVLAAVLPNKLLVSEQRSDLPQMSSLLRFIDERTRYAPRGACVYIISSSYVLNSSHITGAPLSLNRAVPAAGRVYATRDVDRRDGFPEALLTARLVLVADPVQTHLSVEQKVITMPARLFLSEQGFARAFARDSESFSLEAGVRLYAFDRVRPSTPEEIAELHREIGMP